MLFTQNRAGRHCFLWSQGLKSQQPTTLYEALPQHHGLQDLLLCGLYVLSIRTIKQKLIKQESTGGWKNTVTKILGHNR